MITRDTMLRHIEAGTPTAHIKSIFGPDENVEYLGRLIDEVPWQSVIWRTGRPLPRLTYRYETTDPRIPVLDELIVQCEASFECEVIGVWCNHYRNGNDHTPPHQDGYGKHIITYSFGASRRFKTESLDGMDRKEYLLESGDVFYFSPSFDNFHRHSILKGGARDGPRVSVVMFTEEPYSANVGVEEEPVDNRLISAFLDVDAEGSAEHPGFMVMSEEEALRFFQEIGGGGDEIPAITLEELRLATGMSRAQFQAILDAFEL